MDRSFFVFVAIYQGKPFWGYPIFDPPLQCIRQRLEEQRDNRMPDDYVGGPIPVVADQP